MGAHSKIDDSPPGSSPFRAARRCRSAPAGSIVDLRHLLAERFPQVALTGSAKVSTGLPAFDHALEGGLPKGAITELTSSTHSAGTALLIYLLLHHACQHGQFIALIDGRDSFDPQPLGYRRLRSLLWVRCTKAMEAVKAADLLLRDGNFPVVILDLVLNAPEELQKIPQTSWYRLQRLIEPAPTAFLVLTRHSMISSAQWKLMLKNAWQLADLQREETASQLQIHVQRIHGGGRQEFAMAEAS